MIPITIHRRNAWQWLRFGLLEAWRITRALFSFAGSREAEVTRHVEQNAVKGSPDSVISTMDEYALERRFLMNVGKEKGDILLGELHDVQASRVLELGAYCGYSAVLMGKSLAEGGGKLISIEASERNAELARRVVAHAGLSATVEIQVGKASECISQLEGPFDLVFIDHWKDDYLPDLQRLERANLLRPGSRVVADNVGIFSNTLEAYLDYVRHAGHMRSAHHPAPMEYRDSIDDGVEVSEWRQSPAGAH